MERRFWLLALLAFAWAGATAAQEIHKCIGDGAAVAYQNTPCAPAQIDAGPMRVPGYADPAERDGASAPAADASLAAPPAAPFPAASPPAMSGLAPAFPFRTSVALGMTDDQVLNLAGWGPPSTIVRTGAHGNWRELWTYGQGDDTRRLSFTGGRLVQVTTGERAVQVASMSR
jgi:hypothetical protein